MVTRRSDDSITLFTNKQAGALADPICASNTECSYKDALNLGSSEFGHFLAGGQKLPIVLNPPKARIGSAVKTSDNGKASRELTNMKEAKGGSPRTSLVLLKKPIDSDHHIVCLNNDGLRRKLRSHIRGQCREADPH